MRVFITTTTLSRTIYCVQMHDWSTRYFGIF